MKGTKKLSVLVVAPTRELALQTQETMEQVGGPFGIRSVCVFGGVDKGPQKKALSSKETRIVVGTPGRLLDLANEGACDLSRCVTRLRCKLTKPLTGIRPQCFLPCTRRG
jgi:ATP-dependent RNA helicase DBP3